MIGPPATWCMYHRSITPPPKELLDINIIGEEYRKHPYFAYPMPSGDMRHFADIYAWYDYVQSLRLQLQRVLLAYVDAFDEALRALFMAYALPEFCKLGKMKVLATLEGALLAAYKHKTCTTRKGEHRCAMLADILNWANEEDSLPAEWLKHDVSKKSRSDLSVIRNKQMHGEMLQETLPWGGLFEVVKETIQYAYRNRTPYDIHKERQVFENGQGVMSDDLNYVPPCMPMS
ncbi:MAG: hypothetical protein ACYDHM_15705, partial [Acidiferrobacterales bacterium]